MGTNQEEYERKFREFIQSELVPQRERFNITQQDLADEFGVNQPQISRYEGLVKGSFYRPSDFLKVKKLYRLTDEQSRKLAAYILNCHPDSNDMGIKDFNITDYEILSYSYREYIVEHYSRLFLPLVDNTNPIPLDDVYFDIPIMKPINPDMLIRFNSPQQLRGKQIEVLDEIFKGNKASILIGTLGIGKTTTLQYLNLIYARQSKESLLWKIGKLIPFYTPFHKFATYWTNEERSNSLQGFVHALSKAISSTLMALSWKEIEIVLQRAIENKEALIMLDALDEFIAPESIRKDFISSLQHLFAAEPLHSNSMIITSRYYNFAHHHFSIYTTQDLDASDVEMFSDKLIKTLLKTKGISASYIKVWRNAIFQAIQSPNLKQFWTPLYITMMIQLGTSKSSPEEGVEILANINRLTDLYTIFINETIYWEKSKPIIGSIEKYDIHELKYVLGYLAYYKLTQYSSPDMEHHLANNGRLSLNREVIRTVRDFWLRTGIITKGSDQEVISFHHSGFQSYGVAFILAYHERDKVEELFSQHRDNPNWSLVWLLFHGLTAEGYQDEEKSQSQSH